MQWDDYSINKDAMRVTEKERGNNAPFGISQWYTLRGLFTSREILERKHDYLLNRLLRSLGLSHRLCK